MFALAVAVVIAECDCDLVAVGARGASTIRHMLLGSVAESVVQHAPCDVLVARHGAPAFELP